MISIIGIPSDKNSSFLKGASKAPPLIMREFYSDASNTFTESGIDLKANNICKYIGCIKLDDKDNEFDLIKNAITLELEKKKKCFFLGGDHSITYPIISAYKSFYSKINILHFDAHPDLYQDFDDNPYSHASPFARIMENKLADTLTQIGIRTTNSHQNTQIEKYNVQVISMKEFSNDIQLSFKDPVYITIDLDGLDPAFAPGVSHPEPGGLSTRDILKTISNIKGQIIGGDIVEYNPKKDINNITAITASKLLKETLGYMVI